MPRRVLDLTLLSFLMLAGCRSERPAEAARTPSSERERTLHAVGLVLSQNIAVFDLSPDELEWVIGGLRAGAAHRPGLDLAEYQSKADTLATERMPRAVQARKTRDAKFVEELARQPGAQVDASGLVYVPVKEGTGPHPKRTDLLKVHYKGTLTDGTTFDASIGRGEPLEVKLEGVIPCWSLALPRMAVGGRARIACPSEIAYGDPGHPPGIPGGATLLFEIELIGIRN